MLGLKSRALARDARIVECLRLNGDLTSRDLADILDVRHFLIQNSLVRLHAADKVLGRQSRSRFVWMVNDA